MKKNIKKAFAEVNDIVMHSETAIQEKIPSNINKLIKDNMDTNYEIQIDYSKNINDQELLSETRDIMAIIYRDYLCDERERIELIEKNKQLLEEDEKKYNITEIFNQKKQNEIVNKTKSLQVIKKKRRWHENMMQIIREILNKIRWKKRRCKK